MKVAVVAFLLLLSAAPAVAQAPPPQPVLLNDHVVVTAQRQDADTFVVPGAVTVVTRRDLEERLPRSTPEALMEAAGVFVQKTNHGGGSPFIRGLVGNQVLVLVDGIRLNNSTYRLGPNQYLNTIDPGAIERIEIVRGAGAVLYGTDALGGVVHIVTRTPTPRAGGWYLDARTVLKAAAGTPEATGRIELEGGRGHLAWLAGASLKSFGDLRAGGDLGVRAPSSYDEAGADLKVHWAPLPTRTLTLNVQRVRQENVGRFDQVAQRGFEVSAFDPQERWLASGRFMQQWPRGPAEQLTVTIARQDTREVRRSRRVASATDVVERDAVRVLSGSLDVAWRPLAGWRLASGVDVTGDDVDSERIDSSRLTGVSTSRRGLYADDAAASSAAVFLQAQREFGRVHVEGGARYADYRVRASAPDFGAFTLRADALVAQAGLSLAVTTALRPYTAVWQGFRAPNVDDVSALGSFDFGVETPTTSLRPESSVGVEVGLKWRSGRWAGAAGVYRMGLADLIERVRGTWQGQPLYEGQAVYVRDNIGTAYVRGVEVQADYALTPDLRVEGWLTQTHGQQIARQEPMRRIPPVHGMVGVGWRPVGARPWLELRWRGAGRQDRLAQGDRDDHRIGPAGTAAWHVLALRGGWRASSALELVGGVENAADQPYRIHGSGIDGTGRTIWVGAHVRPF